MITTISDGITAVKGIKVAVAHAGIKSTDDIVVIFSNVPASTAAVYTRNRIRAPFIAINKTKLAKAKGKARAVLVVSGVANALTGRKGADDVLLVTKAAAMELGVNDELVLNASTGKIGELMPVNRVKSALKGIMKKLGENSYDAARAIMTTDSKEKEMALRFGNFTIGAIAKGSGMISPDMATMLCFIATDAKIGAEHLQGILRKSVDASFNMLSVDGDTSTNDMVLIMANGVAGVPDTKEFEKALGMLCTEMAKKIAADGEGATKLIEVTVANAPSSGDAKKAALAVVKSQLVKAAVHGEDPNFGRILCAVGYSGAIFDVEKIDACIGSVRVVKNGAAIKINAGAVKREMKKKDVKVTIDLKAGVHAATAYGCDLSEEYVKINALYHT